MSTKQAPAKSKGFKPHQTTSHELAQMLLAEEDLPVFFADDYISRLMVVLSVYSHRDRTWVDIGPLDGD